MFFFRFFFSEILPTEAIDDVFGTDATLHWVARYQVHIKSRGVLASKGYLVYIGLNRMIKSTNTSV